MFNGCEFWKSLGYIILFIAFSFSFQNIDYLKLCLQGERHFYDS